MAARVWDGRHDDICIRWSCRGRWVVVFYVAEIDSSGRLNCPGREVLPGRPNISI